MLTVSDIGIVNRHTPLIKDGFIAILLVVSLLASFIGGVCGDVHAESYCSVDTVTTCSALDTNAAGGSPCTPDSDHPDSGHCDDCCSCPCHTCSHDCAVTIKHSPFVASLVTFEPFSAVPEVVIPKFVPPENLT